MSKGDDQIVVTSTDASVVFIVTSDHGPVTATSNGST